MIHPSQIYVNESFDVSLDIEGEGLYDVKVFVHNSDDEKITQGDIISTINSQGQWISPWQYLQNAYPTEKKFSLKLKTTTPNMFICSRIRESGKTKYYEKCDRLGAIAAISKSNESEDNKILLNSPKFPSKILFSSDYKIILGTVITFFIFLVFIMIIYVIRKL